MSKLSKAVNKMNKYKPMAEPLDYHKFDRPEVTALKKKLADTVEKVKNDKKKENPNERNIS